MTTVEVAVVGGGPAGAVTAALLAGTGHEVVLLERAPAYRWRACGVFASPAAVAALRRVGVARAVVPSLAQPIPAMRVETPGAPSFRLTYGDDGSLSSTAVGFDRARLDPMLLGLARSAGADVRQGAAVIGVAANDHGRAGRHVLRVRDGATTRALEARLLIGADGIRSLVAGAVGVRRPAPIGRRTGLTFHLAGAPGLPSDARMVVLGDAYVGLAPVPGDRINVGIVLGRSWDARLAAEGARATVAQVLASVPIVDADGWDPAWRDGPPLDAVVGASPIGHRVSRRAGRGWLLVGDAAGFLDPFTGEGLHRALVGAELAAAAADEHLRGRGAALPGYERAMRRRFASKDIVSLVVQAFLAHPALLAYATRRLAARPRTRETMGLVIGDLAPASRALDPRFLAALLRP